MSNKVSERRDRILETLTYRNVVSVVDLAKELDVSIETIRKDVTAMANMDLISRVHGGVGLLPTKSSRNPSSERVSHNSEGKRAIAQCVLPYIQPNTSIIIEASTTTYQLAIVLTEQPELLSTLTIITNSYQICRLFEYGDQCQKLFMLGGLCSKAEMSTAGHYVDYMLQAFHAHQSIISGAGINKSNMLMAYLEDDLIFQSRAIQCANEVLLMVDKSKFDTDAWMTVSPLSAIDHIFTDVAAESIQGRKLTAKNLPVVFAE